MNDLFKENDRDEELGQRLAHVAQHIDASPQFTADLEGKLRSVRRSQAGRLAAAFGQASPVLRGAVLMILLAVALSWSIQTLIPAPQPATGNSPTPALLTEPTATPSAEAGGYDFRGGKLYLSQPLPESPAKAYVYLLRPDEPSTQQQARALADRLGVQGEMYTAPGLLYGTTNFVVSDGQQFLQMHSERYFTYSSNITKSSRNTNGFPYENAQTIILDFLQSHGFGSDWQVSADPFRGGYNVRPLAPDALPMEYEPFTQPVLRATLDENGGILNLDAALMDYDPAPLGEFRIIGAEEALQRLLDDNHPQGQLDFFYSGSMRGQDWYRDYPNDQPLTIYGNVTSNPAVETGKPALILIDGTPATGNTAGMESLDPYAFVRARGQYIVEAGIRKFRVESWDPDIQPAYLSGILRREGGQVVLISDDGSGNRYPLIDPPADVPLDTEMYASQLSVDGVLADGKVDWRFIHYDEDVNRSGGGGGGSSIGFYKLNLSGTPVPFPSPTITPAAGNEPQFTGLYTIQEGDTLSGIAQNAGTTVDELMRINGLTDPTILVGQKLLLPISKPVEQTVEDLRGYLSIAVYHSADGTSRKEYNLEVVESAGASMYTMEGSLLEELDAYHGLPILISGTIDTAGKLIVDRYEIPYPDLQFQILKGTQRAEQIEGQNVLVFTAEGGTSYVEFLASNPFPLTAESFTGRPGDRIQQEVLIIPGETFGGMPVAHVYQSAIVQEGGPELEVQANRIPSYSEANDPGPDEFVPPNLTVTSVELTYLVSNPYYQVNDPNYSQRSPHLQPVWHFHGRYDDGSEFDILIQALTEEFLLPELVPGVSPG